VPAQSPAAVAVLGTGIMGAPMARRMSEAGLSVSAWNRTREKAEALSACGVRVADSPAAAAQGARLVVTMLSDADAVLSAIERAGGAQGEPDDRPATWLQMSTVGVRGIERCAEAAKALGLELVDAPVLGTRQPAEEGKLTVLASGAAQALERAAPVFDAVAARTVRLGEVGQGTRLKLVLNQWVLAVMEGVAETIALAEALEMDPRLFLEVIGGGPLDAPYAQTKAKTILDDRFDQASFGLSMARKDARLVAQAAHDAGASAPLAELIEEQMGKAVEAGHGDEDMAATYWATARRPARA